MTIYTILGDCVQKVVEAATQPSAVINTDEWGGYWWLDQTSHQHSTVVHEPGKGEWAKDEDGDGRREVHTNTIEGFWTGVRNFLRPFRGISKKYLQEYVAVYGWGHNYQHLTIIHLLRCMLVAFTTVPS